MRHLLAYYESIDPAGVLQPIAAVPDETVNVNGDDITVPNDLPNIIGQSCLINDASAARAQVATPTLRGMANLDFEPIVAAAVFGSMPESLFHPEQVVPLTGNEDMNFNIDSNPASAAVHYGLVHLADGAQAPVSGDIFSVRATGTASLSAGTWVNTAITLAQDLQAGRYQLVGLRARGTNLVAARVNFKGGFWRPGVEAVNAVGDEENPLFRNGRAGVLGEFEHNILPSIDCLGVTDSAQVFILDLIKVA